MLLYLCESVSQKKKNCPPSPKILVPPLAVILISVVISGKVVDSRSVSRLLWQSVFP
jgi:hypothetical protein